MNRKIIRFFLISIFLLITEINMNVRSEDINKINSRFISKKNVLEKELNSPEYILGPGDQILIEFSNLIKYSGIYIIDNQGFIDLPELNLQYIKDKTISELKLYLLEKYAEFIYNPQIKIKLHNYRPVKVTLRGEVFTKGLFIFNSNQKNNSYEREDVFLSKTITPSYFLKPPTLFDLIQKGNGLTRNADLSKITVIRKNSISAGGGKIKAEINLFDLIDKGNQNVNIELRDGDDIIVGRSENALIDQITSINSSNLTPSSIAVFINGNVQKNGELVFPQGISLYEAIAAAGKKSLSGNIEFIRFKRKGKTEKRIISYNENSVKGSTNNPILLSGDIIYVRKNILGQTTQAISEYSSPFLQSYGIYKLFD